MPELSCLASEDAGCVLVSERLLFRSPDASPALQQSRTGTVLHEMAHMWFGDCATQEWWDDLWLSESFAEYCEATAQSELGLDPDAWSVMSVDGEDRGLRGRPAAVLASGGVRRGDGQRRDRDLRRDQLREGRRRPAAVVGVRRGGQLHQGSARLPARALLRQRPAGGPRWRPWARPRARTSPPGRGHGWRPRGRTCCAASSAPTRPVGSPSSRSCRRHQSGTRSFGRTVSRSACTGGPVTRWRASAGCTSR